MKRRVDKLRDAIRGSLRAELARRVVTAHVRERGLQDPVRLLHRDVLLQASNHAQRSIPAVAKGRRVLHRVRDPHIRGIARLHTAELWFRDADDLEVTVFLGVVPHEPAPDDPGIAAEPLHPECVAQDGHGMPPGTLFIPHRQQPASSLTDAEPFERVTGDKLRSHRLPCPTRRVECHAGLAGVRHGEQVDPPATGVAQAHERRIAEHVVLGHVRVGAGICQVDQALGLVHRERPENQRIDQRERRHARAQRQGQRHDCRRRNQPVLAQHPYAQAHVAHE